MAKEQVLNLSRRGDLKKSMTNIASECRSENIVRDHALILPDGATPKPDGIFGKHTSPANKTAEVVQQVDPNDPLQHFNQPYYRHRRRVARRVYQRSWRY